MFRGWLAALVLAAGACGPKEPPSTAAAAASAPSASTTAPAPPSSGPAAQVVNATILTNGCQSLGATHAQAAEKAMNQLIEGCSSVPGGRAEFEATLQPGGTIDIKAVPGQPDVVPICVLKHSLVHKVPLTQPCRLDVKIEQMSLPMAADAGR
jgi:hypothetical protein